MSDKLSLFIDEVPSYFIKDGLVHANTTLGEGHFDRVMSINTFRETIRAGQELLESWDRRGTEPIPISKARRGK